MIKEAFRRFVQHLLGGFVFEAPGLIALKMFLLRRLFTIGPKSTISYHTILAAPHPTGQEKIVIGRDVVIGYDCSIDYAGGLEIQDGVWISESSMVCTHSHEVRARGLLEGLPIRRAPLVIGAGSWIGAHAIILPQVRSIGCGAVIGAGSIVTRDVPEWTIVAGNPARVIGSRE